MFVWLIMFQEISLPMTPKSVRWKVTFPADTKISAALVFGDKRMPEKAATISMISTKGREIALLE